jgi:hypothetical protein
VQLKQALCDDWGRRSWSECSAVGRVLDAVHVCEE